MTALTFRVNKTSTDSSYASVPANYVDVTLSDALIASAGLAGVVADGLPIPVVADLNRAATLLNATLPVEVDKYFLADASDNLLREIFLAGSADKRYVFCCSFDGATATEPILEAWDDTDMDSYLSTCLGTGIAAASWYKAICTTSASPGAGWTGIAMAGAGSSNSLLLNAGLGPLSVAKDLYFNFYILIPAGITTPGAESPILAITYTTN